MAERLVLKDNQGQIVRSFQVEGPKFFLIQNHETNRLEIWSSLKELDKQKVEYTLVTDITRKELMQGAVRLPDGHEIALDSLTSAVLKSDELEDEKEMMQDSVKWTAITHATLIVLVALIGYFLTQTTPEPQPEPVIIDIAPPVVEEKPQPKEKKQKEVVKPSETKLKKQKVVKVAKKPVKVTRQTIQHTKVFAPKTPRKNVKVAITSSAENVDQFGALRTLRKVGKNNAFGTGLDQAGKTFGGKGSGGLGYGNAGGQGGGGLGEGVLGGTRGVLPGKGLLAASPGSGSAAGGVGGYGQSGSGGGKEGRGQVSFAGQSKQFAQPLSDEAEVEGGLDRDQIDAVVRKNMGQIIYCYEQGLQSSPGLRGRITSHFMINGQGGVSLSKIAYSSLRSAQVEGCVAQKIRGWRFPKPIGGVTVDVNYPFELTRVGQR